MSNVDVTRDAPRAPLAPVDPNVSLPPAVRAAAERAEAYYKKPEKPAEPAVPAAGEPPAAPAPVAPAPAPQPAPAAPVVTAPVTPPAPAPVEPAPVEGDDNADSWKHKYQSMNGRFHAQQNQLRSVQQQMSELGGELMAAQQMIQSLQAQHNAPPRERLVTEQEETDYGAEFINVARKAAKEALDPEVEGLRNQVQHLTNTIHQTTVKSVYAELNRELPAWRTINRSPEFNAWLLLRDPMSGVIRKGLLDGAFRSANAEQVVTIFKGFVADDAANRPADPAPPPQPAPVNPAPATRQPAVSLETLAAPGRARVAPATPPAPEKPIYTNRQIAAFYDDVRKGVYAGRMTDKDAIEQDIFLAQREGRVKG